MHQCARANTLPQVESSDPGRGREVFLGLGEALGVELLGVGPVAFHLRWAFCLGV